MIDKVLHLAMWPLVGLSMALFVAGRLLHVPWLETAAWVSTCTVWAMGAYFAVQTVALVVRRRRERRAVAAAARAQALADLMANRDPRRGAWRSDWV